MTSKEKVLFIPSITLNSGSRDPVIIKSTTGIKFAENTVQFDQEYPTTYDNEVTFNGTVNFNGDVVLPRPPIQGLNLEEITNITVTNPVDDQVLAYNDGTWINKNANEAVTASFDVINENTPGTGVTIDGVLIKDNNIETTGSLDVDNITINTGAGTLQTDANGLISVNSDRTDMTGFKEWNNNAIDHYTLSSDTFAIESGKGYIHSQLISWDSQNITLTKGSTYLIYIDNTGTIQQKSYETITHLVYQNNIMLFLVYHDASGSIVVRENHSYVISPDTTQLLHAALGVIIQGQGGVISSYGTATNRQISISADTISDSGLNETISIMNAPNITTLYLDGSGNWKIYGTSQTLPKIWNNSGTPTESTTHAVIWLGMTLSNGNPSAKPQIIGVIQPEQFNTRTLADAYISTGGVVPTTALKALEIASLGYVTINCSTNIIEKFSVLKSTVNSKSIGGATMQHTLLSDLNGGLYNDGNHANLCVQKIINRAPNATDSTVKLGTLWVHDAQNGTGTPYQCTNNTSGSAVWERIAHGIPSAAASANTIVVRDASADVYAASLRATNAYLTNLQSSGSNPLQITASNGIIFNNDQRFYHTSKSDDKQLLRLGLQNFAVGQNAGIAFSKIFHSIAIGYNALSSPPMDGASANYWNIAIGYDSMANNAGSTVEGKSNGNVSVGNHAMKGIASYHHAYGNVAIGDSAMRHMGSSMMLSTNNNTAVGRESLGNLSCATNNVAVGYNSGVKLTSSDRNVILGADALSLAMSQCHGNVAIGSRSGKSIGDESSKNIAIGNEAMTNTTGRKLISCIAIGDNTTPNLGAGSENVICIGSQSGSLFDATKTNMICIGHPGASGTAIPDNSILLGGNIHTYMFLDNATVPLDTDTSETATHVLSYNVSTGRVMRSDPAIISRREFKQNIRPVTDQDLEMIMKLQPVQYQYKKAPTEDRFGLIVEDVEQVMPQMISYETISKNSSVGYANANTNSSSNRRPYALKYENLTTLLLAVVQRLVRERKSDTTTISTLNGVDVNISALLEENTHLKSRVTTLERQLSQLMDTVTELQATISTKNVTFKTNVGAPTTINEGEMIIYTSDNNTAEMGYKVNGIRKKITI